MSGIPQSNGRLYPTTWHVDMWGPAETAVFLYDDLCGCENDNTKSGYTNTRAHSQYVACIAIKNRLILQRECKNKLPVMISSIFCLPNSSLPLCSNSSACKTRAVPRSGDDSKCWHTRFKYSNASSSLEKSKEILFRVEELTSVSRLFFKENVYALMLS